MCVKLKHAKCQPPSAKKTFLNWGLNGGDRKNVRFATNGKWPYLGNGGRYGQDYY